MRRDPALVPALLLSIAAAATAAHAQCPPLPLSQDRCYKPAYTSSQWTTVYPNEGKVFHILEGVPQNVTGGGTDNCLSHVFYDINMDVRVDPQYACLIADGTLVIHTEREFQTMPLWLWPNTGDPANPDDGDRVWMAGTLIYDCGHCNGGSDLTGCYTEIHPIIAMATIRSRPDTLGATGTGGYVPAVRADMWINGNAGCANAIQCVDANANCPPPWPELNLCGVNGIGPFPIDKTYHITMALPPRPTFAAQPVWRFETTGNDDYSTVTPTVTYVPSSGPGVRDSLHVDIDLTGQTVVGAFARSIIAGWTPGWSTDPIHHFRVDVTSMHIFDDLDGILSGAGDWYFEIAVNGAWQPVFGDLRTFAPTSVNTGQDIALALSYEVAVQDTGSIMIQSHGFDDDAVAGCTITNGDPGQAFVRWTAADGFGVGQHAVRTMGGDIPTGAARIVYSITEVGSPTAIAEGPGSGAAARGVASLSVSRAVADRRGVDVTLSLAAGTRASLRVLNAAGQLVRTLLRDHTGDMASIRWDATDDAGAAVSAGVYVIAADTGGRAVAEERVIVVP